MKGLEKIREIYNTPKKTESELKTLLDAEYNKINT